MHRSRVAAGRSARSIRNPQSPIRNRHRALTLVELMVAIAIVAILSTLLLGAAGVASETARDARTKSLVARLHTLLMERYDGYRSQRVETKPFTDTSAYRTNLAGIGGFVYPTNLKTPVDQGGPGDPRIAVYTRLAGLREVMKFEMPDRWSDILGGSVQSPPATIPTTRPGYVLQTSPQLYSVYARAYNRLVAGGATKADILENESAECLYLIITNATGDGEARGMFKPTDVADTDGDGAPEFVDGWGNPISFLRWAPGFASDAQQSVASLVRLEQKQGVGAVTDAILDDHDPFDLFRVDNPDLSDFNAGSAYVGARGWRLVPLVVSNGGDEELGLRLSSDAPMDFVATLDPYDDVAGSAGVQSLGEATDLETSGDNISNHNVGALSRKR